MSYSSQVEERRTSKSGTPQASFDTIDSDSDEDLERELVLAQKRKRVNLPAMRQKLTGHRNARTMIKVKIPLLDNSHFNSNPGSSLVGQGLYPLWFGLRPPLCLGSQHWRVCHDAGGRQVIKLHLKLFVEGVYIQILKAKLSFFPGMWSTVFSPIQPNRCLPPLALTTMSRFFNFLLAKRCKGGFQNKVGCW